MFSTPTKSSATNPGISDYLGITSATVCLIHCLVAPFYIGFSASVHSHTPGIPDHWFLEHGWDYVFLVVGFAAVWFSSKHTGNKNMKLLLWVAFSFLAAMLLMESYAPIFQFLAYIAAFILIIAHLANLRKSLAKTDCQNE
ncbi:MAG: MerC domain-containing protein [Bacteroidia bacterium]|nr:MerC domain-containing protein [Bacteroidia bacterium]